MNICSFRWGGGGLARDGDKDKDGADRAVLGDGDKSAMAKLYKDVHSAVTQIRSAQEEQTTGRDRASTAKTMVGHFLACLPKNERGRQPDPPKNERGRQPEWGGGPAWEPTPDNPPLRGRGGAGARGRGGGGASSRGGRCAGGEGPPVQAHADCPRCDWKTKAERVTVAALAGHLAYKHGVAPFNKEEQGGVAWKAKLARCNHEAERVLEGGEWREAGQGKGKRKGKGKGGGGNAADYQW